MSLNVATPPRAKVEAPKPLEFDDFDRFSGVLREISAYCYVYLKYLNPSRDRRTGSGTLVAQLTENSVARCTSKTDRNA